jgi:hypothetical protein
MSGETEKDESGWTTDTLNYYLSGRIDDLRVLLDERYQTQQKAMETALTAADKAVQAALAAQEKAITKAETAAEKRFESVNEFRATLADQQSQLLTRGEYDAQHDALVDKVNGLADRLNRSEGQSAGVRLTGGVLVATITAAAAIVGVVTGLIVVLTR